MMPGLENPNREQPKTRTEDICVIRESKPSGEYIVNFTNQNMYRARKQSLEGTRGAHEVGGRAQGGRAHPPPSWGPHVLPGLLLNFLFF